MLELNWNQRLGHKTKLNICHYMLTSSTQLQNRSFHVVERTRTSLECQKFRNARAKRAKILFFIVKYANLRGFCCRRRRGCLSSLMTIGGPHTVDSFASSSNARKLLFGARSLDFDVVAFRVDFRRPRSPSCHAGLCTLPCGKCSFCS